LKTIFKKLHKYFEDKTVINKGNADCVNYRYAAVFLNAINATPYCHSGLRLQINKCKKKIFYNE